MSARQAVYTPRVLAELRKLAAIDPSKVNPIAVRLIEQARAALDKADAGSYGEVFNRQGRLVRVFVPTKAGA